MSGCEEVREILVAAARGEMVSAPGAGFLREHVETCPPCRRWLANERMLSAGLAAMASSAADPPAAMKTRLLAEFRQQQQVVVPIRRLAVGPIAGWVAAAAVAAALLAAVLVKTPRRPEKVTTAKAPVVVVAKAPESVTPPVEVKPKLARRAKAHSTKVTPAAQPDATPEVATDFFEIPYVEPLRPDQRADVFRVQIPRAGMAAFGLPVVGGRLDSRVTADVLMGEDGVVRAVRFIR